MSGHIRVSTLRYGCQRPLRSSILGWVIYLCVEPSFFFNSSKKGRYDVIICSKYNICHLQLNNMASWCAPNHLWTTKSIFNTYYVFGGKQSHSSKLSNKKILLECII